MSGPHAGFYVHYHGMGHKHRTEAILKHLSIPATVVTSRMDSLNWNGPTLSNVVGIECDNEELNQEGLKRAADVPCLHFAPLWSDNISNRVAKYTAWLADAKPDVMVVDVSAEISQLTRLSSIPQIVMRQHGDRSDPGHLHTYAAAHSLLAPFPQSMEDEITPDWVREKTVYLHGFCRSKSGHSEIPSPSLTGQPTIVFMFGRGGTGEVHERLRATAESLPAYRILVIGKERDESHHRDPANLHYLGWVNNAPDYTASADVVVTAAGHNSVMELGYARAKFIAIAQPRPFNEQIRKVNVLHREQLAIGLEQWPDDANWPELIHRARRLDPSKWDDVFKEDGAKQAADHIHRVALWSSEKRQRSARISL
ncbi:glycosyltransferase [Aporhodopirellula aestuarii]|uniref:Glycosyl transferase family 28 protein n=1 Tax=Aporhodopirellula aestuarii TaxID=2950107 RepID=A0ABT0UA21_9BACT|nr:glycosyltransferase [Aporhodopirellula aestuarii]MCM2373667.1 glycosyl transferase family 28 protein [Aporhodopirellula aestuarii]